MAPSEPNDMTRCARIGHARGCLAGLLTAGLLLAGCATAPPPLTELDAADAALMLARDAQAADLAPVELGFAESRRAEAAAAMAERDHARARVLAAQAEVDATLAAAKSRAASARAEVQRKTSENASMRRELLGEGAQR